MALNFDEILLELSYRVPEGYVDLTKDYQVTELSNILKENGYKDAFELAHKARVYFSYLTEAGEKKKKDSLDTVLAQKFVNPDTKNNVTVASALGYDKKSQAYSIAKGMMSKAGYSEKDIDMVDAGPDDEETPTNVFGTKGGGKVFDQPKPTAPTSGEENVEGTYNPNNKLQRDIAEAKDSQSLMNALETLGKEEEDLMLDKVKAGAGGPVASTGETLCTEAQTDMIDGTYNPKEIRKSKEYQSELKSITDKLKSANAKSKKSMIEDLEMIANKLGFFTEDGSYDYGRAMEMKAEEELYIKTNLPAFKRTNVAKTKFNKEEDMVSWMKASFYSSYSLINNGPTDWDRKKGNGRVMKANATTDGAVKQLLENKLKNAKTPKEREHYEKQLKVWDKFKGYHDTYMVYTDKDGNVSAYHISNKKSDKLNDPQNNTTPEQRLRNYEDAVKERKLNPKSAKIVNKAQEDALAGSADNDNIAKRGYTDVDDTNLLASLSNRLPARSQTDVKDEYYVDLKNDKTIKDSYKKQYGDKWESKWKAAKPNEIIDLAVKIASDKKTDISKLSGNFTKFILKNGQLSQSVFAKAESGLNAKQISDSFNGIYSPKEIQAILSSDTMKKFADIKAQHASGLEGVHKGFITELHKADGTKPGHSGPNGPAVETYVAGTLKALHIDTYVTNYDDNVQIEMGGVGVRPSDVRSCMASLSGFKGDIGSSGGRQKLNEHLAKNVKVDADSDAVYLLGSDGKTRTYLASDTWRQAGSSKKIATGFGSDLRKCLTKAVAARNKK